MTKHNKFLFKKRNHVHILGFDVTSSSCYHFTSLGKQLLWRHRGVGNERNLVYLVEKSVEIMRNQSRFPWNQARKSAQLSSPTHFYNVWHHFWGKSRGNQREIRKSHVPKLLVANPSDGTDVPHVPGTPNYITWAKYRIELQGTK